MSEAKHLTTSLAAEQPKFLSLMCIALLFRLAGQQTFHIKDISEFSHEFDGIRVDFDEATGLLMMTLHRPEEE